MCLENCSLQKKPYRDQFLIIKKNAVDVYNQILNLNSIDFMCHYIYIYYFVYFSFYSSQKKTLEINTRHPLIKELKTKVDVSANSFFVLNFNLFHFSEGIEKIVYKKQ